MKSTILRLFPAWNLILVIKLTLGIEYTHISIIESVLVAFVWATIHEILGNKTSYRVLKASYVVFGIGVILNLVIYKQCPLLIRIIYIAIGIYMLKVAVEKVITIEIRNKDKTRKYPYMVANVFGVTMLIRYIEAIQNIAQKGADALGVKMKYGYHGYSEAFKKVFYKLYGLGYGLHRTNPDKTLVFGRDGIAILRTIDEAGNYEFKEGKWYKDGKKCTDFNKEASSILGKLSGERGTNKVILVKTFEGGSVNGAGCGMFVTDITKGDKKLMDAVNKITRVENLDRKLNQKAERISAALLSLK